MEYTTDMEALTLTTLRLRRRGSLTIPAELRKRYKLEEGEPLTLVDFGGVFILSPKDPLLPKLKEQIHAQMRESEVEESDLLEDLDEIRSELYEERYGS